MLLTGHSTPSAPSHCCTVGLSCCNLAFRHLSNTERQGEEGGGQEAAGSNPRRQEGKVNLRRSLKTTLQKVYICQTDVG